MPLKGSLSSKGVNRVSDLTVLLVSVLVSSQAGTFEIKDRNGYTSSPNVTCIITGTYWGGSMTVCLDTTQAVWEPNAGTKVISLAGQPQGMITIWARLAEDPDQKIVHAWMRDSTLYDTQPPISSFILSPRYDLDTAWPGSISGTAYDSLSGLDSIHIAVVRSDNQYWQGANWWATEKWHSIRGAATWSFPFSSANLTNQTSYTVRSRALDKAGNIQVNPSVASFTYDARAVPRITSISPTRAQVLEGSTATFTVVATSADPITYSWMKIGGWYVGGNGPQLVLSGVTRNDSGSIFECTLRNSAGTVVTSRCTLEVFQPVKASFRFSPTSVQDSGAVTFTDQSTGSIGRWVWDFGDGGPNSKLEYTVRPSGSITYRYARPGNFTALLTTIGTTPAAGRDSVRSSPIRVYSLSGNPLVVRGRILPEGRVELRVDSLQAVSTDSTQPPFADSIGIWFGRHGGVNPSDNPFVKFKTSLIQTGTSYSTILAVPLPTGLADTLYTFWVSPLWGKSARPSPFSDLNATRVRMLPQNLCTLTGRYLGNTTELPTITPDDSRTDSALITIGNANAVDGVVASRVVMRYAIDSLAGWSAETLSVQTFTSRVAGSQYQWRIGDSRFLNGLQRVSAAFLQIGKNGLVSDPAVTTFTTGWPRPTNQSILSVTAGSQKATKFSLNWTPIGQVEDIRILYSTSPIEPGFPDTAEVAIVRPHSPAATEMEIGGLIQETRYFCALQIRRDRQWSTLSLQNMTEAHTTGVNPADWVTNSVTIESAVFDSVTNRFRVKWRVDPIQELSLEIGFTWDTLDATAQDKEPSALHGRIVPVLSQSSGETILDPGSKLRFNATFTLCGWLRSSSGPWSAPTSASTATVRTSSFGRQIVQLFPRGIDTVSVFNDNILLRRDTLSGLSPVLEDTIRFYVPRSLDSSFIDLGIGTALTRYRAGGWSSLFIGMRVGDLPPGFSISDVGVYRDSATTILAVHDFSRDTINRIFWVKASSVLNPNGIPHPMFLLIDKKPPHVSMESDTTAAVSSHTAIQDRIRISDNIGNVQWSLWYAKNGQAFGPDRYASGYFCGTCADSVLRTTIPDRMTTGEGSVRALLTISDGVHTRQIDISRQVIRKNSDPVVTNKMEWTPFTTTAVLDEPLLKRALAGLSEDTTELRYNPKEHRIVTWASEGKDTGAWIEYTPNREDLFRLVPGRLFWIKTRIPILFDLRSGATASLKSSVEISLPPRAWTDFALPFSFDVNFRDVSAATGKQADSLEVYQWTNTAERGKAAAFTCEPLFIDRVPTYNNPDILMPFSKAGYTSGFTVWNPTNRTITLRIPPISTEMSRWSPTPAKRQSEQSWAIQVLARSEEAGLPTVVCGFSPKGGATSYFPKPPAFSAISVGVRDPASTRIYGHAVAHTDSLGGALFPLIFQNPTRGSVKITYQLHVAGNFPGNYVVKIADPSFTNWESVPNRPLMIEVPAESSREVVVGAGEPRFYTGLTAVRTTPLALLGSHQSRTNGLVTIRFSLPQTGIGHIQFEAHDLLGRMVWRKRLSDDLSPGVHSITLQRNAGGILPRGIYVIGMRVTDDDGKCAGHFRTKIAVSR